MASTAWGYLLLPGIKNWAVNLYPQVFSTVKVSEDFAAQSVNFDFQLISGLWVRIVIINDFFYDSKQPGTDILAVIKGQFDHILAPGIKQEFMAAYLGAVKDKWNVDTIHDLLKATFPDEEYIIQPLMHGNSFKIIFKKNDKLISGKNWMTVSKHWLKKYGEEGLIKSVINYLGYKKKPAGAKEYSLKGPIGNSFNDDTYWFSSDIMLAQYGKYNPRQGQFYEEDGLWIPVGLTLADIT